MKKISILCILIVIMLFSIQANAAITNTNNIDWKNVENETFDTSDEGILDQYNTGKNSFGPIGRFPLNESNFIMAQSFTPQKNYLTKIELLIGKNSSTTYPYKLAIREELTGEDLAVSTVDAVDIETENYNWTEFSFNDVPLNTGDTYYMVSYTQNETDNWYAWGANDTDPYANGSVSFTLNDEKDWETNTTVDMCFKTYGKDTAPELDITITGGMNINLTIENKGDADAHTVSYELHTEGGLLGLIDVTDDGVITTIEQGDTFTVEQNILGIGLISVNATVNGVAVEKQGLVILFFVILL